MTFLKISIIFLFIVFSTICKAEIPKEYQVDKTKWKNPSDYHTRISTLEDGDEIVEETCTKGDDDCELDDKVHEWQEQEWAFAWITISAIIVPMIFVFLFSCFVCVCQKRRSATLKKTESESESLTPDISADISETDVTEKDNTETEDCKIKDDESFEEAVSKAKEINDEKPNIIPKIEFEDEFHLFGPIESEVEEEEDSKPVLLPEIKHEYGQATASVFDKNDSEKEIEENVTHCNIKVVAESEDNNLIKNDIKLSTFENVPLHDHDTTISTDDDEDFFVIGKKEG